MIRAGLVGYGGAADTYVQISKGMSGFSITKVFGADRQKAKAFAKKIPGAVVAKNESDLLDEIDALIVACPPGAHYKISKLAADKGIHIFVEKPVTTDLASAKKLIAACKKSGAILTVNFQYRNSMIFQKMKKAVKQDALGKILFASATVNWTRGVDYYSGWRGNAKASGGGVIMSHAIHVIDFMVGVFGMPEAVFASAGISRKGLKVEDNASVVMMYSGGLNVLLKCSTSIWPETKVEMEFNGTRGRLRVGRMDFGGEVESAELMKKNSIFDYKPYGTNIENNRKRLEEFVGLVKLGKRGSDECNFGEVLDTMKVVEKIYSSVKTGKKVLI